MNKPLVFIIDDDEELKKVIERRFVLFGCEATCFSLPKDLLDAFDQRRPKLVLVDLNLGDGLSGFDLIRILRDEKKSDVPIVILSGEKGGTQIAHGIELGANDYIVKPPLRLDFEDIISKHLKAEHLPEPTLGTFQPVRPEKRKTRLGFHLRILSVQPAGFTLESDHLIRKGASFYLKGPELKKILANLEEVFVTVIGSAMMPHQEKKVYHLFVEVDPSNEVALTELRSYLDKKLAAQLGS